MSSIISTDNQTRWKDSYAASAKVGLTLLANGEEPVQVYTQDRQLVPAGFDAPDTIPTVSDAGAGALPAGYCVYRYCYASSKYPNVEAIVAAGGQLWPKSNPSGPSATYNITASHENSVTVTKTTRADVDKILVYRTAIKSTAAAAEALSVAGELYYVGVLANNSVAGTTVFTDNVLDAARQEQLELDNYTAPQFWRCTYEAPYWWGFGNPELVVEVTLDGTTQIVAAAQTFYPGRQNQFVTFDGITTGGYDGKGTYFFSYVSDSVANVALALDGSAAGLSPTGTTTMRVRGYSATLYRSKPNNPFAWGETLLFSGTGGSVVRVPQEYAFAVGGRGVAVSVLPRERLLKLDCENPSACYVLNLALAGQEGFEASKRTLDRQYIITSADSQITASFPGGDTALCGIDASNRTLARATAGGQTGFGDEVFNTLNSMVTTGDTARLNHGVYDTYTELSVWWIKTAIDPDNLLYIDTAICYHAPSGQFSTFRDFDVTASASVYDPATLETIVLVGTASGQIAQAFVPDVYSNLVGEDDAVKFAFTFTTPTSERTGIAFTGAPTDPPPSGGAYFDIGDTVGPVRVWFYDPTSPTAPPTAPTGGRLLMFDTGGATQIQDMMGNLVFALDSDDAFTVFSFGSTGLIVDVDTTGIVDAPDAGTVTSGALTLTRIIVGTNGVTITPPLNTTEAGTWALLVTSGAEVWTKGNARGVFDFHVNYDVSTGEVSAVSPFGNGTTGSIYPGLIDCEGQMYFQPSQTKAAQAREIWGTFRNHDSQGDLFYRFHREFETTPTGSAITPAQLSRQSDGSLSMNWVARADVNTDLVNQMGYRLIERGYEAFEVLGMDVKNHSTGK